MKTSSKLFNLTDRRQLRARPLTLKEVLRLRDGLGSSTSFESSYPYKLERVTSDENILLALN